MAKKKRGRSVRSVLKGGFSKLTRVRNVRELLYAHAIVHSRRYQKAVGKKQARREHSYLVKKMKRLGFKHHSPLR